MDKTLEARHPSSPPPQRSLGPWAWMRDKLFSTPLNTGITIATLALLAWVLPKVLSWAVFEAVWGPAPLERCQAARGQGACWAVVWEKFHFMMFGVYPYEESWRAALAIGVMCGLLIVSALKRFWNAWLILIWALGLALTFWLMGGGLGLAPVRAEQWGGLPVTLILSIFGIGLAFPLGVLLALGRRSKLPLIRAFSVIYIEVIRGVPLITVLFMASVMFALFLPEGLRIEQLVRAQVAIILFVAAYLAEAVRGGLQAVPKGQYEAAEALGLPYWKMMGLVILPQALRLSIPPIVNSFISLFKDTSLVVIIAIYDFAYAVKKSVETDFSWKPFFIEAFLFSILIYWIFCYAMSKYSQWLERDLARGHTR
ncbi:MULTISPECIES: amino acid ABC transporter permease [Caldimonas]|uniref:amino acid ABC transporter permease n=1 Tax=Caldimonas TaxID=196013 RepID=UPI0003624E59|nr:amino acid ABC transporter permease [Caldimonas manganoxidans]MCX7659857.1 amino acid ABC transporter permease [Caldimonas manganoxidans]